MKDVVIIGAGLSGTLMAIRLAQRGHHVQIFEKRPDLRTTDISAGRSINLALSDRGLKALEMAGIDDEVRALTIPMYGRMIHDLNGDEKLFKYSGRDGEFINSISRPGLNALLLDTAQSYDNIEIHFDHEAGRIHTDEPRIEFRTPRGIKELYVSDKITIGADGAGSALRREMQRRSNQLLFNFSQSFLDTGYKELCLPAGSNGSFQIEKNALHIWPREGFMMIALPNLDGSFTVTLFMPFEGSHGFNSITTDQEVNTLFDSNFPDVKHLFPDLTDQWHTNPSSALGTIRCYPWQMDNRFLLLGDAAHAIVPFYGQGMNCSFEDCRILDTYISRHEGDWSAIFENYQKERKIDTDAIADLAEDNFYEMRDATADEVFNRKRRIELKLEQTYPEYYSKYSLVTFREDLPYHKAMAIGRMQDAYLMEVAAGLSNADDADLPAIMVQLREITNR